MRKVVIKTERRIYKIFVSGGSFLMLFIIKYILKDKLTDV
jgi:hypothetical protein